MVSTVRRSYRSAAISLLEIAAFFCGSLCWLGCSPDPSPAPPAEERPRRSAVSEQQAASEPPKQRPAEQSDRSERSASQFVSQLSELIEQQRYDEAQRLARSALLAHPSHPEILFLAARAQAAADQLEVALELLSQIPPENTQAKIAALGTSADWLVKAEQFDRAIPKYEAILDLHPTVTMAHRQLASLLNRLGRRQRAITHLQALCRAGDITQAELASMISRRDPSHTVSETTQIRSSSTSSDVGAGPLAQARRLLSDGEHRAAISMLVRAVESPGRPTGETPSETPPSEISKLDPVAVALLGRASADADDPNGLWCWWRHLDQRQPPLADHWYALGALTARHLDAPEMTADLLGEAVIRDPTDWVAYGLLENMMNRLQRNGDELFFKSRAAWIKRTIHASNRIGESAAASAEDIDDIDRLANLLDQLGRPLEATMWRALGAASHHRNRKDQLTELQKRHRKLVASGQGFTTAGAALGEYPRHENPAELRQQAMAKLAEAVPALQADPASDADPPGRAAPAEVAEPSPAESSSQAHRWRFVDRAERAGLDFQYHNAWPAKPRDLQIYEQFGGGVAALDYDLDGRTDLYFGQAAGSPANQPGQRPNVLYAARGERFVDVTAAAGVDDRGYSLGVTAGDVNQDGFDDLVVCNFGSNTLLINNGDGTYRRASAASAAWQHDVWTASAAIGDVNADGLPDVVEVNYLDDPRVFHVPPRNAQGRFTTYRGPESYRAAADRVLYQRPDGSWRAEPLQEPADASPGLGVVVTNVDRSGDNEVFIANDTEPNQLWRRADAGEAGAAAGLVDMAKVLGCAYSSQGGSGASMGVAASDFDRNGQLDLHVTNFYHEPVHLYLQSADGAFVDSVVGTGLYADSMSVLGFGTTALDVENDGQMDMAVVNGHIEDLRFRGAPYKMRPQLFRQHGNRFQLADAGESESGYFAKPSIGRGLIRLDWNRDGRVDLVATHHDAPAALLENHGEPIGRWLQVQLVGVESERGAVGGVVTVETDRGRWTQWVTGGDGYSCRDEPWLFFGLGQANEIEAVNVQWPDGSQQRFENVPLGRRVLLIQGQPAWPSLAPSASKS